MKKIFISIGSYLPGENGGGPIQSIKNLIDSTKDSFEYYIFTSNHDFNDNKIYNSVKTNQWNKVYNANIFYSSDDERKKKLFNILKQKEFSLIFLNDLFSKDSLRILYNYKLLMLETPLVLMPRGQFTKGALSIKPVKKYSFLRLMKNTALNKKINYLSTSNEEESQITKLLKTEKVQTLSNIPSTEKTLVRDTKKVNELNAVFVSRISPKKNLDYSLKVLKNCKEVINYDIYGVLEDEEYLEKCKKTVDDLPSNITVNFKGPLDNVEVIPTLANYDLFYFTTKSENYGHVISEALQASIPVLISDTTPWRNLAEKKLGWDFSLDKPNLFSEKLDNLALIPPEDFALLKENIHSNFDVINKTQKIANKYISYFNEIISQPK